MNASHPRPRRWLGHGAAAGLLLFFVLLLFAPLLFTNRVLATGDIFLLFGALLPAIIVLYIVASKRDQFE